MKILQVANVRWFNAAADYALRLSVGLAARGHEVHMAGLPETRPMILARESGLRVLDIGRLNSNNPARWPSTYRFLSDLVSREGYDLMCAHFSEGYPLLAAAARRSSPGMVIVRTRGDMRLPRGGPVNSCLYGKWTDGIVASGEAVKKMITGRLGIDGTKIRVIYYGTDVGIFRPGVELPPSSKAVAPPGAPVLGYVGRLGRIKGEACLVKILCRVAAAVDNAHFIMVIKEEEGQPDRLKRELTQAGLMDRTTVMGNIVNVAGAMNLFSVGLVTSVGSEVNCRVLQEMMACRVPAVATRVGVIPEVVEDGETGFCVPPGNPEAAAAAAIRILKDDRLRHKMGKLCRQRAVGCFSLEGMLDRTEEWYAELKGKRERRWQRNHH